MEYLIKGFVLEFPQVLPLEILQMIFPEFSKDFTRKLPTAKFPSAITKKPYKEPSERLSGSFPDISSEVWIPCEFSPGMLSLLSF